MTSAARSRTLILRFCDADVSSLNACSGETFSFAYSPKHRWYYVPKMRPDEILAFKLCDPWRPDVQWSGHTAFDDPTSARDARPRESIEIRTISFF